MVDLQAVYTHCFIMSRKRVTAVNPDRSTSNRPIGAARLFPAIDRIGRLPWWGLILLLLGVFAAWSIASDQDYRVIFSALSTGITLTVGVTLIAFSLSIVFGLILGLGRVSKNPIAYHLSTVYVEIMRGLPILVVLLYAAFVVIPAAISGINNLGSWLIEQHILPGIGQALKGILLRDLDYAVRVIIALTMAYAAFIAEVFRSGIESIDEGQVEAARALGMTYWQTMRYVVLRQAIRRVLPPLGNDFIAMLKDSSLVSVLGVADITYQGKIYAVSTFEYFQTYNVLAFLYLTMTLLLSLFVKWLERRMSYTQRA